MSLTLKNVVKSYGREDVLHDISLDVSEGDFLVLLGSSGCGKSTLLNCVAGLEDVTSGRIEIKGRDVTRIAPADRNVAMVFQSYALYPTMTVARNIGFGLECARVPRTVREEAVRRVAKTLQIDQLLERKPNQLSGGQRQRVAIGRALVRDPDLFLLDEPMSNLDTTLRNQMRFELRELHRTVKRTFVLVTHDQTEAMSMATMIAVLDKGYVQQFGTPYDVFYRPQNRFVAEFVGTNKMNFLEGQLRIRNGTVHFVIGSHSAPLSGYGFISSPEDGQKATLGVRPENIYRQKGRLEGHECLEANLTVTRSELMGGDVQVWFDFEHQTVASRFRSTRTPEDGAKTTLYMDMQNVSVFDPITEKRL